MFDDPENEVTIKLHRADAETLARLFRMVGSLGEIGLSGVFDDLATSLGADLGISTSTDETDHLDEDVSVGTTLSWQVFVGADNVPNEDVFVLED